MAKASEVQVGDRVVWPKGPTVGRAIGCRGIVRRIGEEGDYRYAVIAAEPYGQLYMPPLKDLVIAKVKEVP